jgi:hypothetical protein
MILSLENLKYFLNNISIMSSLDSIIFQLTSGLITETSIPTYFLHIPIIHDSLIKYNWAIQTSNIPGWTIVVRQINYSN